MPCSRTVREVAPAVWVGSATAARFFEDVDAWLGARFGDDVLRPVLGYYGACDRHGTADPTTHPDRTAAARSWDCPYNRPYNSRKEVGDGVRAAG